MEEGKVMNDTGRILAEILSDYPEGTGYLTVTRVEGLGEFYYTWSADDIGHAIEQCKDAFPGEEIVEVRKVK